VKLSDFEENHGIALISKYYGSSPSALLNAVNGQEKGKGKGGGEGKEASEESDIGRGRGEGGGGASPPPFTFLPWLFLHLPKASYDDVAIQKAYVEWLMKEVGVRSLSDLRPMHFKGNHGLALLARYNNSVQELVLQLSEVI